jgi:hypothetical protein
LRRLRLIRFALRELLIPTLVALGGLYLTISLGKAGKLEAWHLPLLAGMMMTPLVAVGGKDTDDPPDDLEEPER